MAPSDETNEEIPAVVVAAGNENDDSSRNRDYYAQGYTIGGVAKQFRRILALMASPLTDEIGSTESVMAGITTIVLFGACLGLAAPSNEVLSPSYRRISAALGYIYFTAWSVSFYPQVISNFKRKSTVGLSPDFCVLNVIGFACYAAYNASFYWSPSIRELYKERFGPDAEITVQSNDVAFAIHALGLSLLTVFQIVYYNYKNRGTLSESSISTIGNQENSNARLSKPILFVIFAIAILCIGYLLLVLVTAEAHKNSNSTGRFNWLDFLYLLSYVKIFISLIKYIPQVILNVRRKSTAGWSIWNILLDLTGGTLSDMQLVLDCVDLKDFSGITHNKAKLALGSLSIVFDLIFLVQHYCLYSGTTRNATDEQLEPLIPPTEEGDGRDEAPLSEESSHSSSSQPQTFFV